MTARLLAVDVVLTFLGVLLLVGLIAFGEPGSHRFEGTPKDG